MHYDEVADRIFCHTCMKAFKEKKMKTTKKGDPSFVLCILIMKINLINGYTYVHLISLGVLFITEKGILTWYICSEKAIRCNLKACFFKNFLGGHAPRPPSIRMLTSL